MDDLVRWIGVQLDEDERIARAADPGPWKSESLGRHDQAAIKLAAPTSLIQFDGSRAAASGTHVARHDPSRVLREVEAKREIVRQADLYLCDSGPGCGYRTKHGHNVLRLLALPYADRPGFQEAWRP